MVSAQRYSQGIQSQSCVTLAAVELQTMRRDVCVEARGDCV